MIAEYRQTSSTTKNDENYQRKIWLKNALHMAIGKDENGKNLVKQVEIAMKVKVRQDEISRALSKDLAVKNTSFIKLCSYAEKFIDQNLVSVPHKIQVAYTKYKKLGGEADVVAQMIEILTSERCP